MLLTSPLARPSALGFEAVSDLRVDVHPGLPLVVEVCGEVDIQSAPWLRDELLRTVRRHEPRIALDLAGVTFLDCAGINALLSTRRRALLEGGRLQVVRPSARAWRVISLLGLQDVLTADSPAGPRSADFSADLRTGTDIAAGRGPLSSRQVARRS